MTTTRRIYAMLGNESLWEVAQLCHGILSRAGIPYCIAGGVAVCIHGYQRNTTDVDLIIEKAKTTRLKRIFNDHGLIWDGEKKEFHNANGIAVQILIAGESAGRGSTVKIPVPTGELNVEEREGLIVARLSRLIEMKLASGMNNLRRTHRDFADVVELIAVRKLDAAFAKHLHPSLRPAYRKLVQRANYSDR